MSPKLKLQSAKKLPRNSTVVSKLCVSLSGATLGTPLKTTQRTSEPLLLDIPKICEGTSVETPPLAHENNCILTSGPTPIRSFLHNINETPTCTPGEMFLETPKTTRVQSHLQTPLCVSLKKSLAPRNVNSTPRRSSRRSCVDKLQHDETKLKEVLKSSASKETLLKTNSSLSGHLHNRSSISDRLPGRVISFPENETALSDHLHKDDPSCQEKKESEITLTRKIVCVGSTGSYSPLDWLPASFKNNKVLLNGSVSERKPSRKSDIGVYSARKLSFSAKKPDRKQKNYPEYDPDNDIFAHGLMPVPFNIDNLKHDIQRFMNTADVPSPHLRRSVSCSVLDKVKASQIDQVTTVSPKQKQSRQSTPSSSSKTKMKKAFSTSDLLQDGDAVTAVATTTPSKPSLATKNSSEGRIRALLHARDIINRIRERAKNVSNVPSQKLKPSDIATTKSNSYQISDGNVPSCTHVGIQNRESAVEENNSLKESVSSDFDDAYLPPTQPFESFILGDVTAYVEVISKNEDLSAGVRKELVKLGATVVPAFNRDVPVTHVVFSDGHISTYKKAKKRNIPLVSVLWIEECRKTGVKVHESLFPPYQIERYESPAIVKELKKRRIMRLFSDKRPSPRQRKGVPSAEIGIPSNESPTPKITVQKSTPKWVDEVAGDNGMVRMLVNMTGIGKREFEELVNRPSSPESDTDHLQDSPLPVRLLRQLAKDLPKHNNLNGKDTSNGDLQNDVINIPSMKTTLENHFVEKLNEAGGTKEAVETSKIESSQVIESLSSPKGNKTVSCLDQSDGQNITQRKKTAKRKLLSPVVETVTVANDGDGDDVKSILVENPHLSTPKVLINKNIGKKRKSNIAQRDLAKITVNAESEIKTITSKNKDEINSVEPIRRSRRSSSYFVKAKSCAHSPIVEKPALVCTQLHTQDVDMIASIVDTLGTFVVEKKVSAHTTHVVTGAPKRTMKVLKGMARGCWIVAHEWVLKSLEATKWLDEEEFEVITFSPAVQKYRLDKLCFGEIFKPDIFSTCGSIFVSSQCRAPRKDLVELILLCGGHIVSRSNKAKVAVGKYYPGIISVSALWVLDSVQYYCCKPFDCYLCTSK